MEDITKRDQASTKEVLQTDRPPIYFSFDNHAPGDLEFLPERAEKIESLLKSRDKGVVVVYLEHADLPLNLSKDFGHLIEIGKNPTEAFSIIYFKFDNKRGPLPGELEDYQSKKYSEHQGFRHTFEQMKVLNSLVAKHPDRVKIMLEGWPSEKINIEGEDVDGEKLWRLRKESIYLFAERKFGEVLYLYRRFVRLMANVSLARNQLVIDQLRVAASEKGVSAVVVWFGSGHTQQAHMLKREGYKVAMNFEGKSEQGRFEFLPEQVLIRSLCFNPGRQMTEIELYQALLGQFLMASFCGQKGVEPGGGGFQEIVRLVNKTINEDFSTVEKIKEF